MTKAKLLWLISYPIPSLRFHNPHGIMCMW
nr:MAG TPA: hypothetical protein [Caudoviricetes sp.]